MCDRPPAIACSPAHLHVVSLNTIPEKIYRRFRVERKYDINNGPKENFVADSPISVRFRSYFKERSFVLLFLEISKPLFIFKVLVSVLFFPCFILKYAIVEMIAHVFILLVTKECRRTHFCFNGRKQITVINFSTRRFAE